MELTHVFEKNVVRLFGKKEPVMFRAIAQVDGYWEGLRAGRLMPNRSEVDPRGLSDALEFAFMLEHIAPGVGRMRIAGMHLNDLLGMETRGMPFSAFFDPAARERIGRILDRVVTEPMVADVRLVGDSGIGRAALPARLFMAPLAPDGGGPARILGALQSVGSIGRAPRRFSIENAQTRRIVASAAGKPSDYPGAPGPVPRKGGLPAFAEPAGGFDPAPRHNKGARPHPALRLVKNDD